MAMPCCAQPYEVRPEQSKPTMLQSFSAPFGPQMPVDGPELVPPPQEYGVPTHCSAAATAARPLAADHCPDPDDEDGGGEASVPEFLPPELLLSELLPPALLSELLPPELLSELLPPELLLSELLVPPAGAFFRSSQAMPFPLLSSALR